MVYGRTGRNFDIDGGVMGDSRFMPEDIEGKLAHVIEECGEVLAAIGKTQRFGLDSTNPLLPEAEQETNRTWLHRELKDLKHAISSLMEETEKPMDYEIPDEKYVQTKDFAGDGFKRTIFRARRFFLIDGITYEWLRRCPDTHDVYFKNVDTGEEIIIPYKERMEFMRSAEKEWREPYKIIEIDEGVLNVDTGELRCHSLSRGGGK